MAKGSCVDELTNLNSLRKSLVRQEDTIIFALIERAKYPLNSKLYRDVITLNNGSCSPLFEFFVKGSESVQAKASRYLSPEEYAFFPSDLPSPLLSLANSTPVLHPPGDSININDKILNLYLETLLPLIASRRSDDDDDGNYSVTASNDLNCLQALSRRIHYGKFVAEVKFRDSPEDYIPEIQAKDRDALMNLLTFPSVEEVIIKRVEKKAMVFGQDVDLNRCDDIIKENSNCYKVDPSVVSRFYQEWVIPLTKFVQVEYLLRRLD